MINAEDVILNFAESRGGELRITNQGKHWTILVFGNRYEWWPTTSKFVKNKQWEESQYFDDYEDVIDFLTEEQGVKNNGN